MLALDPRSLSDGYFFSSCLDVLQCVSPSTAFAQLSLLMAMLSRMFSACRAGIEHRWFDGRVGDHVLAQLYPDHRVHCAAARTDGDECQLYRAPRRVLQGAHFSSRQVFTLHSCSPVRRTILDGSKLLVFADMYQQKATFLGYSIFFFNY